MIILMKECLSFWYIISFYINNFYLYNKITEVIPTLPRTSKKKKIKMYKYGWISSVTQESVE